MGAVFCKERKINMKRCFSLLLSLVLLFSLLPGTVLASGQDKLLASGTISLADGLSGGDYSGTIMLEPMTDGEAFSTRFNFTGTSCSYEISSYKEVTGTYYLSFTVQSGSGVICNWPYYYVAGDTATTDRSQATPITLNGTGTLSINLTIPKAWVISGRFVSASGGAVVWNSAVGPWLSIAFSDGRSKNCRLTVDGDGTWSTTLDPQFTGQATLSSHLTSEYSTNILTNYTYYYNNTSTSAVTNEADASTVTLLGSEDITGLDLYVDTGWLLSGQIHLPEGGYITHGTVDVRVGIKNADGSYTDYWGNGTVGPDGGSWSAAVPKQAAEYQVTLNEVSSPGVPSNIYWGEEQTLSTGPINGDTDELDFTLVKAGAVITGTAYRPEGVEGSLNLNLCALVKRSDYYTWSYNTNASIDYNSDSGNFSIAIPTSETATEYQLYYNIFNSVSGIVTGENIYLCSDGSLTAESNQAGTFSLANPPAHEFTLLTAKPFVSGKIYCPEGLEQTTTFVVYPQRASEITTLEFPQGAVEVMVGPGNGQQDEEGHWFSTYSLNDPSFTVGTHYHLVCYSNDSNTPADTSSYYVNQDGTLTKDIDKATVYTISDTSVNTVNFTPFLWNEGSDTYMLQSEHGISSLPQNAVYTYTCPGADSLKVTFSDRTDMDLTVNDNKYAYSSLAGQTLVVAGDTLRVELAAFTYSVNKFGFAVEEVTPDYGSSTPQTGAAAVYTPSGSSENAILSDVNAGQSVRVTLVGQPAGEQHELLGALYDEKGILLDFVQVPVTFTESGCTTSLSFEEYGGAVTLKIFLVDEDLAPQMENCAFTQQ